jgi:hypothetical protein
MEDNNQSSRRAVNVELTADDLKQVNEAASHIAVHGARYTEASEKMTGR